MKKILFIIATFCLLTTAHGQQFSFQMFFTDAVGNKDTITLGYDSSATDSIDTSFGEVNIISVPLKTSLDVRITNEWVNQNFFNRPATHHLKKQIFFNPCLSYYYSHIQTIDILSRHWPVTATWDNTVFNDKCRNGSVFTSIDPACWWDVGCGYSNLDVQILAANKSATFSPNKEPNSGDYYGYIIDRDTISSFWLAISDLSLLHLSIDEKLNPENKIKVFPNPASEIITIQVPIQFGAIKRIEIFSALGQLVKTTEDAIDINIAQLAKGVYFVGVANEKGGKLWTRMIKE
jgi:hypothetical protein